MYKALGLIPSRENKLEPLTVCHLFNHFRTWDDNQEHLGGLFKAMFHEYKVKLIPQI